ncbi:hypothetical protein [Chryseobacterium lathyri]|uniref:hypothetical protein n=1 Tax=Chryseobacterium lathyri TaxID=395933 RepID=UPI001CC0BD29|nr:hypothetical protein [Chryseobacterium lathyri]
MRNEAGYDSTQMNLYRVGQDVAGSDYYSQSSDGFFQMSNGKAYAYTTKPNFFTMKSTIHYAKAAFASKELLFTTMVHETAHSYAMYGGNAFIKYLHDKKLFNSGYSTIGDLGHAAIYDLENHLSAFNKFPANPAIGMDKDFILNAINNNVTGNNVKEFNMLRNFLLPVFNRKLGIKTPY